MIIKNKQYEKVKNEKIWSKLGTRSSNLAPVNLSKNKSEILCSVCSLRFPISFYLHNFDLFV